MIIILYLILLLLLVFSILLIKRKDNKMRTQLSKAIELQKLSALKELDESIESWLEMIRLPQPEE